MPQETIAAEIRLRGNFCLRCLGTICRLFRLQHFPNYATAIKQAHRRDQPMETNMLHICVLLKVAAAILDEMNDEAAPPANTGRMRGHFSESRDHHVRLGNQ
jgi:hypothetical protein